MHYINLHGTGTKLLGIPVFEMDGIVSSAFLAKVGDGYANIAVESITEIVPNAMARGFTEISGKRFSYLVKGTERQVRERMPMLPGGV